MSGFIKDFREWVSSLPSAFKISFSTVILLFICETLYVLSVVITPFPPTIIDILLTINLTLPILFFSITVFFPGIIPLPPIFPLIFMLFRLGLRTAVTRSIFLHAYAGELILRLGSFRIRGNVVKDGMIFLFITIIQFIVVAKIAKYATKIANKQTEQGEDLTLQKKDPLWIRLKISTDFLKKEAIIGIAITMITIVGGLYIGTAKMDLSVRDSAITFLYLAIGDGLLFQIPVFLLSTAFAISMMRISTKTNTSE